MSNLLLRSALCLALLATESTLAVDIEPPPDRSPASPARAVILIIGDGMDEQQITIARNYLRGASGRLLLDQMPLRSNSQILAVEDNDTGSPVYVADSANTATSMATGAVTARRRIATTAGSDQDLETIVELAAASGYGTGIVTTASVTDATPAAFATHISHRLCENPESMEGVSYRDIFLAACPADMKANGGKGSIAEQLIDSQLDVILGGGSKHFAPMAEGTKLSVLELARQQGFEVVSSTQELIQAESSGRLLGLFSPGTMPVRLQGENGRTAEAPEPSALNHLHGYLGEVTLPEPMTCEPNPSAAAMPSLQLMTETALDRLSRDNPKGFFLMVESASIDKQSHERKPCGSIGELEQLEEALASALSYAQSHPHTLVLVTADHSQAAQLVPFESHYAQFPIPIYTPGKMARIRTPEGSLLAVNYATNNFSHEEHTGASVPLFSNNEGLGRVPAYITQPEIFTIMRDYLQL
jgi:alkaline phosphatase